MKKPKIKFFYLLIISALFFLSEQAWALSTPHHLYNISRRLVETVGGPFYGLLVQGPRDVKKAYVAEVWEQEKPEHRGLLRYKLMGLWRAPGEETKGIITGITDSVASLGKACKEFVSIFFGD